MQSFSEQITPFDRLPELGAVSVNSVRHAGFTRDTYNSLTGFERSKLSAEIRGEGDAFNDVPFLVDLSGEIGKQTGVVVGTIGKEAGNFAGNFALPLLPVLIPVAVVAFVFRKQIGKML